MSTTTILLIIVAVVLLAALFAAAGVAFWRRRERRDLRERFGPEYERLESERDPGAAVDELKYREARRSQFDLRELNAERREHYQRQWLEIQREFVDHPAAAVVRADALIQDAMRERGYPVEDFEQRARSTIRIQHYRQGHELASRNAAGEAITEELREGFIHYRELFVSLVGEGAEYRPPVEQRDRPPTPERR